MNYAPCPDQNHDHNEFSKIIFVFYKSRKENKIKIKNHPHFICHSEWMVTVEWFLCLERLMMLQEHIFCIHHSREISITFLMNTLGSKDLGIDVITHHMRKNTSLLLHHIAVSFINVASCICVDSFKLFD